MKRDKFFEAKKEWFALKKKRSANLKAQRVLGWVELEKPRFAGYKKNLVLRDDIARRDDALVFQEIIDRFGAEVYSRRKDFLHYCGWSRKKEVRNAYVRDLAPNVYLNLSPQLKKWFTTEPQKVRYSHKPVHVCVVPEFFFAQKISRHYITKVREFDETLKKEESELDFFAKKNPRFSKMDRWYYGHGWTAPKWYRRCKNREEKSLAKRALHKFLREGEEYSVSSNFKNGSRYW